jgi:hypothetical protein
VIIGKQAAKQLSEIALCLVEQAMWLEYVDMQGFII